MLSVSDAVCDSVVVWLWQVFDGGLGNRLSHSVQYRLQQVASRVPGEISLMNGCERYMIEVKCTHTHARGMWSDIGWWLLPVIVLHICMNVFRRSFVCRIFCNQAYNYKYRGECRVGAGCLWLSAACLCLVAESVSVDNRMNWLAFCRCTSLLQTIVVQSDVIIWPCFYVNAHVFSISDRWSRPP